MTRPLPKNKKLNKSKKKKGGDNFFGGHHGYKGVNKKAVNRLVGGIIKDEKRDIRDEHRMLNRSARQARVNADTARRRALGDLSYVQGETADYLEGLRGRSTEAFGTAQGQQRAAAQALQSQLGDTYTGATSGVNAEMARLGITGAANNTQLLADSANAQAVGAQSSANSESTLGLMREASDSSMGFLQGMNAGQYQSNVGNTNNAWSDTVSKIQQTRQDGVADIRRALRDVKMSRRDLFTQLLHQMQETGWNQFVQAQSLPKRKRRK